MGFQRKTHLQFTVFTSKGLLRNLNVITGGPEGAPERSTGNITSLNCLLFKGNCKDMVKLYITGVWKDGISIHKASIFGVQGKV